MDGFEAFEEQQQQQSQKDRQMHQFYLYHQNGLGNGQGEEQGQLLSDQLDHQQPHTDHSFQHTEEAHHQQRPHHQFQFQSPSAQYQQSLQQNHQHQQHQHQHSRQQHNDFHMSNEQSDYDNIFGIDQYDISLTPNNELFKPNLGSPERTDGAEHLVNTVSFSMPGAFKSDNMDLDQSPPFTIDSNLYVEPVIGTELFPKPNTNNQKAENSVSPFDDSSRVSSYTNVNYDNVMFAGHNDRLADSTQEYHKGSIDSHFHNENNPGSANRANRNHSHSNASISMHNLYNELSPLTTTTSLTPSVGSVHSTQPSFFSANQYITRNSMEQPPSSIHRPSFDYYSKNRASIDSQHSSQHQRNSGSTGRYTSFTNSITNMLPFMGDRNQRSPLSGPPSPQNSTIGTQPQQGSQPQQQSRHLIRSIFKSSINNANSHDGNGFDPELDSNMNVSGTHTKHGIIPEDGYSGGNDTDILMSPNKELMDFDTPESALPTKKARRSKRSLFTRFKTPIKSEQTVDEIENSQVSDEANSFLHKSSIDNESLENSLVGNVSVQNSSISLTPSAGTQNNAIDSISSNTSHGPTHQAIPEPDYAALFENVGKRKHIVSSSSYRKPKTKVKTDPEIEKHSILGLGSKSKVKSELEDYIEDSSFNDARSDSISSTTSLHEKRSNRNSEESSANGNSNTSAIANASKRILGSKLYQKKKTSQSNMPAATMISKGVEVEVDLESLDLPPDTQIVSSNTTSSKNRTRGRKENKEADLSDSSKIYLCNYCSRRFKRQEHLKRHFRSLHTLEKPYDCPICQKKFSRSDNLNQHLKTHKQEEEMEMAKNAESNMDFVE